MLTWNADDLKNKKIKQTINTLASSSSKIDAKIRIRNRMSNYLSTDKGYNEVFNQKRSFSCYATPAVNKTNKLKTWYKGLINPISILNKKGILKQQFAKPFFTIDLETITINSIEVVVAISSCGWHSEQLNNKIFLIDHNLLKTNQLLAVKQLWTQYFTYLTDVIKTEVTIDDKITIFAHNLGSFDGYFIFNGLMMCYNPDHISSIIDHSNAFIAIQHLDIPKIEFKDSLRVFPISLNNLCKMFCVEGKLTPYNSKFNNIDIFNNSTACAAAAAGGEGILQEFIEYSKQDAKALYEALKTAQTIYWETFKVDIESVYSTATLSLKIFRTHFQKESIYILPNNIDAFTRNGYFGGGTDVYKGYAKKAFYYDVNSLYPAAMLNPMPHEILNNGKMIDLSDVGLESFFGFAYVRIFCPLNMERPVLPFHQSGKTIYPVGTW
jgi:hypothetical protein